MVEISQSIDNGHGSMLGKFFYNLMSVSPDDEAMQILGHYLGGVCNRFASSDLCVLRVKHDGKATKFVDANFKGDPCPGATLIKE